MQLDRLYLHVAGQFAACARVAFAPESESADVDKRNVRVAVVAGGEVLYEAFEVFEINGVEVVGLPACAVGVGPAADCELYAFAALVFKPLGCRPRNPVFAAVYADCELFAALHIALRGRVEDRPVVFSLFGFYESPRNAHVLHVCPRKPVERVGRFQVVAVVARSARIVVVHPAHSGVYEGLFVVLKFVFHAVVADFRNVGSRRAAERQHRRCGAERCKGESCHVCFLLLSIY